MTSSAADASKVPPSRFQNKEGSIYGTPSLREGHVKGSEREKSFHDKLKEKVNSMRLNVEHQPPTDCLTSARGMAIVTFEHSGGTVI